MQIEMVVVSKSENPPHGDRTFARHVVVLQPTGGGALLELVFDDTAQADAYQLGQVVKVSLG